jgi:hypothetical protein
MLELEPTIDKKAMYIKILAPFDRLCEEAKAMKLRMPLSVPTPDVILHSLRIRLPCI